MDKLFWMVVLFACLFQANLASAKQPLVSAVYPGAELASLPVTSPSIVMEDELMTANTGSTDDSILLIEVFDADNELAAIFEDCNSYTCRRDLSFLSPGNYTVKVTSENQTFSAYITL